MVQGGYPPGGGYPPTGAPLPDGYGGYGPPIQYGGAPPPPGPIAAEWSPTAAISFGWERIKSDPGGIAVPLAVGLAIVYAPNLLSLVVHPPVFRAGAAIDPGPSLVARLAPALQLLTGSYMYGGITTFALNVARGEPYRFGDVFSGGRIFGPMFVVTFLSAMGIGLGSVLLIVPGVILALGWALTHPLVVDENLGGVDALRESWRLMDGHKGKMLVLGLMGIGLMLAGVCTCGVGLLLVDALMQIAVAWVYLRITGQRTVDGA